MSRLITLAAKGLRSLALGGTAVGTGLSSEDLTSSLKEDIRAYPAKFVTAENKFHALTSKDRSCSAHKALAADMMKIANDVRWLAKRSPLRSRRDHDPRERARLVDHARQGQSDAVRGGDDGRGSGMGNDVAVGMAASQGNFELNVFMPVCAYNFLQSARLLAEAVLSFNANCAVGIKAKRERCTAIFTIRSCS